MAKGLSIISNQRNEKQENKKTHTHICTCILLLGRVIVSPTHRHTLLTAYIFFLIPLCSLKWPKRNDTVVAMNTSSTKIDPLFFWISRVTLFLLNFPPYYYHHCKFFKQREDVLLDGMVKRTWAMWSEDLFKVPLFT